MTIARMADATGHDWGVATSCCKRCGGYWLDMLAGARNRVCLTAPNLIAVSHTIARRKHEAAVRDAGVQV